MSITRNNSTPTNKGARKLMVCIYSYSCIYLFYFFFLFSSRGTCYFLGTIYKSAHHSNPSGEHLFYKQEVYLTAGVETLPISDISGRCAILDYKEYCSGMYSPFKFIHSCKTLPFIYYSLVHMQIICIRQMSHYSYMYVVASVVEQ